MGLDTFLKSNILPANKTLQDGDNMELNKNVEFYMKLIKNKQISKAEAARKLNYSRQWITEIFKRYINNQDLEKKRTHRRKKIDEHTQEKLIDLYKRLSYTDESNILHTPSMEIIKSIAYEQIDNFPSVSTQTIRNYLKLSKNYPKRLKSRKYRKRFEAKYVGEIIQGDVSIHNWIPGIDEKYNLILFIDDKSRYILYAKFVESDSLENHITALKEIFFNFGLPISIYYDNDSKYNYIRRNGMYFDLDKQLEKPLIPNALDELGINLINSKPYQPQGKGKVERKFLTFQNQLPHYMLLENAKNIDDANRILAKYVEKHNKSYSKAINSTPEEVFKNSDDAFKQIKKSDIEKIENSLTRRHKRVVSKVNEISFNNKIYQVPKFKNYSLAGFEIEVRENPNNWIKLFYKGNLLTTYNIGGKIYV